MPLRLPRQGAVDRSKPYDMFLVHKRVFGSPQQPGGEPVLLEIQQVEVGGGYGSLPGDPQPAPRHAACLVLPGPAQALCLAVRGRR